MVGNLGQGGDGQHPSGLEGRAGELGGVGGGRQAHRPQVGGRLLGGGHPGEGRRLEAGDEPGQLVGAGLPQGGGGPQGVAPGQAEAAEGAGGGQALDGVGRGAGAAGEVLQVLERAVGPFGPDALQQRVAEVTYVTQPASLRNLISARWKRQRTQWKT